MAVADAQACIDAREFAEWIAYYNIEPFGLGCAMMQGTQTKKRSQSVEEMQSMFKGAMAITRKGKLKDA